MKFPKKQSLTEEVALEYAHTNLSPVCYRCDTVLSLQRAEPLKKFTLKQRGLMTYAYKFFHKCGACGRGVEETEVSTWDIQMWAMVDVVEKEEMEAQYYDIP